MSGVTVEQDRIAQQDVRTERQGEGFDNIRGGTTEQMGGSVFADLQRHDPLFHRRDKFRKIHGISFLYSVFSDTDKR